MATLEASTSAPFQRKRRLQEPPSELTVRQKEFYNERIMAWKAFKESPLGKACLDVAEKKMGELMNLLSMPVYELAQRFGLPPSEAEVIRSEARGEYKVWYDILNEQHGLFEALARMQVEEAAKQVQHEIAIPPNAGKVITR